MQQWHILTCGMIVQACSFLFKFGTSAHSLAIAAVTALCVILHAIYTKRLELQNKAVLAAIVYVLFASWQALKPINTFTGVALPWYGWPVIALMCVYFLFYSSIKKEAAKALPYICWIGFIASVYCILQAIGFDTPMVATDRLDNCYVPANNVIAWFGHPSIAGCSLAMLIPLVERERKFWMIPFFVVAVLLTRSETAIASMVCVQVLVLWRYSKVVSIAVLIGAIGFVCLHGVHDSGRFRMWRTAIADTFEPIKFDKYEKKFNLTGRGLNSFQYIYHDNHPTGQYYEWLDPHNEYIKCYYELGLIGLCFMLFILISHLFVNADPYIRLSLLCVCISAMGMYVWSLGFTQIMTVYLFGLIKERV